jgi:hypothetical protein
MTSYIVTVVCAAHFAASCPLPNGFKTTAKAASHSECMTEARRIIATFNYNAKDFMIQCREK